MFDLVSSNPLISAMDKTMTVATQRMSLIAGNIANLDTPGFRSQDFDFQATLKREFNQMDGNLLPMSQTHPGHFPLPQGSGMPNLTGTQRPAWERNDGNDVNLDQQTTALARTQGVYQRSASLAQKELQKIYTALREGAR